MSAPMSSTWSPEATASASIARRLSPLVSWDMINAMSLPSSPVAFRACSAMKRGLLIPVPPASRSVHHGWSGRVQLEVAPSKRDGFQFDDLEIFVGEKELNAVKKQH